MLKRILNRIFRTTQLTNRLYKTYLMLHKDGFLYETGWKRSLYEGMPVDKSGNPIPWLTYSFIDFITERIKSESILFEYGSGNSTLFFAKKVAKVVSVEHDNAFYELLKNKMPENVNYNYCKLEEDKYPAFIKKTNLKYDLIVIDGRQRVKCAINSVEYLKENGVIIWDNSLRLKYSEGIDFLHRQGFKRIDFRGLNPIGVNKTATSIFYKPNNILDI